MINNNSSNDNNGFLLALNILANILQIADFEMNISELSNDELMKHLEQQDMTLQYQNSMLNEQTDKYLNQILDNQNKIIELLNKLLTEK